MFNTQRDLEDYIQKVKFYENNDNQPQSRTIEMTAIKLCQRHLNDYITFSLNGNLDGIRHLQNPHGNMLLSYSEIQSIILLLDKPYFLKLKIYLSQIMNEMATRQSRGEDFVPCDKKIDTIAEKSIKIDDENMAEFKSILRTSLIKH